MGRGWSWLVHNIKVRDSYLKFDPIISLVVFQRGLLIVLPNCFSSLFLFFFFQFKLLEPLRGTRSICAQSSFFCCCLFAFAFSIILFCSVSENGKNLRTDKESFQFFKTGKILLLKRSRSCLIRIPLSWRHDLSLSNVSSFAIVTFVFHNSSSILVFHSVLTEPRNFRHFCTHTAGSVF